MPHKSYNQILDEHLYILIAQGNHEAFNQLHKRYHQHAVTLAKDLASQYSETGITYTELVSTCEDRFSFVLKKFNPGLASFYTFWKSIVLPYLMEYIVENSYDGGAFMFKGFISFDQRNEEMKEFSDFIGERGDERALKRKIFEIRHVLHKYDLFFTYQEKALLNLVLDGYSLAELEHSGLLGRSQLNLTYKTAVNKLQKYMKMPK